MVCQETAGRQVVRRDCQTLISSHRATRWLAVVVVLMLSLGYLDQLPPLCSFDVSFDAVREV
jgi:hypothetical protein